MSTVLQPPALGQRLFTVEDLDALPSSLPSGDVSFELDDGRLVIMAPPGDIHGGTQVRIGAKLLNLGELQGFGSARTEVAVILRRNPDTVRVPDVVFVAKQSHPIRVSREGYLETIPDLVVEVRSKNDTHPEIDRKVEQYLDAGVKVVWVADPEKRSVTAHRQGQAPLVFAATDTLTVADVIPGFQVQVAELFPS